MKQSKQLSQNTCIHDVYLRRIQVGYKDQEPCCHLQGNRAMPLRISIDTECAGSCLLFDRDSWHGHAKVLVRCYEYKLK